jgi:hypothetical protein
MRSLLLSLLLVPVLLLNVAIKADGPASTARTPARVAAVATVDRPSPFAPATACNVPRFSVAAQSSCSACADKCSSQTQACKDGSIKSCYLAAACVCRCNLDAGGCGSSRDALKECVEENEKLAREVGQ